MFDQIQNSALTLADVPQIEVLELDADGFNDGTGRSAQEWTQIWTFALSFDGYRFFGGDAKADERLHAFDQSVFESFKGTGALPRIDLALLRACLFMEQRLLNKGFSGRRCPPDRGAYLDALLKAIRISIS